MYGFFPPALPFGEEANFNLSFGAQRGKLILLPEVEKEGGEKPVFLVWKGGLTD